MTTIETLSARPVIDTLAKAEPIGPKKLLDVLAVMPCTGNTLAKLAAGIADTPVTLAVKSHLRNGRPVVVAVSTNENPNYIVARFEMLPEKIEYALKGCHIQQIMQ